MNWSRIIEEGIKMLSVRLHVETCKGCRKKFKEILKHANEEFEKREATKD